MTEHCMNKVETTYKDDITKLRNAFKGLNKIKVNKGTETYRTLLETIDNAVKDKKQGKVSNEQKILNDYINALMYMPSYKFEKVHKFLLGCCLKRIGKHFSVDSDIAAQNRQDLIVGKRRHAQVRATIKTKFPMYIPFSKGSDEQNDDDSPVGPAILVRPEKIQEDAPKTIDDWYDDMKNVSPLLPNDYLDQFRNGTKGATELSKKYVDIFCKTSGNKNEEFKEFFFKTSHTHVLNIVRTVFQKYPHEQGEEHLLLQNAIVSINQVLKDLEVLNECIDDFNKQDIIRIRQFVAARAICLPCNPETSQNNVLRPSVNVSNGFMNKLTKQLYSALIKYMKIVKMPTVEENIQFINEIREKNKKEILDVMNGKTREERDLMNTLKKIGLKYADNDDDVNKEKDKDMYDDNKGDDDDAEDDFRKQAEDDEDDDNLDDANFGFVYS